GVRYVGQFKDNKIHGKGRLTSPSGKELVGQFENGEFVEK
ncbi:MAG: molecular chaperone Tir, partial [Deltaproteobacteria bacterium]|nr:molecular chaperone Tir [Deltaproteobacteria bacterium]